MVIYYTIYETTCLVNGKKYRGAHQTTDPHDDYVGSGSILKRSITKHGRHNFVKEILFMAFDEQSMYDMERLFVDKDWVASPQTYNRKIGGLGGAGDRSIATRQKISNSLKGVSKPDGFGEKVSLTKKLNPKPAPRPRGTKNTNEHNRKISEAKKGKPAHLSTCPHCGKIGGTGAMSRHHFNQCKFKSRE